MKKMLIGKVLATNLARLMAERPDLSSDLRSLKNQESVRPLSGVSCVTKFRRLPITLRLLPARLDYQWVNCYRPKPMLENRDTSIRASECYLICLLLYLGMSKTNSFMPLKRNETTISAWKNFWLAGKNQTNLGYNQIRIGFIRNLNFLAAVDGAVILKINDCVFMGILMVAVFALLFFASLILMIIGLVRPKTFSRSGNVPPTRSRIALIFSGLLVLFFVLVGITAPEKEDTSSQEEGTVTEPEKETPLLDKVQKPEKKQESKTNEEDIKKLAAFHRELATSEHEIDAADKILQARIKAKHDRYEIYDAANTLYLVLQSASMKYFDAPKLENKKAKQHAKKALEGFEYYLTMKRIAVEKLRDWADGDELKPSMLSAIKASVQQADAGFLKESVSLMQAYDELGVPLEKRIID